MAESIELQIAVIGAGIAGLAAAIALKDQHNVEVQIYERASELKEIGASIALGPNGMRTLDRLGVESALSPDIAFRNKSRRHMIYRHYKTGEFVSADTHKGKVDDTHLTSRFYRAHLQEALLGQVDRSKIHLNRAFESVMFDDDKQKLFISFENETKATADIILGADGVHSRVRTAFAPETSTVWTGWVTLRSVFPISHLSHLSDTPQEAEQLWGPDWSLIVSKLGRGLFTVIGTHHSNSETADAQYRDATWNTPGDVRLFREFYKDWHPRYRDIVEAVPYIKIYPNWAAQALKTLVLGSGRVTLAGDAAHAHGGAFAAGGSLALDDAWTFAAAIKQVFPATGKQVLRPPAGSDIPKALHLYERTRKNHTDRVMAVVHEFHKRSLENLGKPQTDDDLRLRMKNRYDASWLHEYNVELAFAQALEF